MSDISYCFLCLQNQEELQPSDVDAVTSSDQNISNVDMSTTAQTSMEEEQQQQQRNQETGSSQQEGSEGHDGISSVSKRNENDGRTDKV